MTEKRNLILILLTLTFANVIKGQILIFAAAAILGATVMPEHGFLPGKKFKYYSTVDKYDFTGRKIRVELFDDRSTLKLKRTQCSEIDFTNTSEFVDPKCIFKVGKYIDTLFKSTGAILDSAATDTLQIRFEGIDSRLIGFGHIRVHGICQMKIKYRNVTKTYCIDITDADKHSPISPNAFVTRLTATRIMASASIREVIEQFFVDLKLYK